MEECASLEVEQADRPGAREVIYVKSRWFDTRFLLSISDGLDAWICEASEDEVARKAFSWDYTVPQYLEQAKKHLSCQRPESKYSFSSLGDGSRKLSWTLEKDGLPLVAHWKVEKAPNPRETTCDILDFLTRGSSRLTDELQRKKRSFEHMKAEAERAQAQSEKFRDQKIQFEADIYKKFVAVLNSKKAKLRELRELALQGTPTIFKKEGSVELTESEDDFDGSDDEDEEASKDKRPSGVQGTEKTAADEDSEATDILSPESASVDVSSHPANVDAHKQEAKKGSEESTKPSTQTSTQDHATEAVTDASMLLTASDYTSAPNATEAVTDASMLLTGSDYTSAPRKRRRA